MHLCQDHPGCLVTIWRIPDFPYVVSPLGLSCSKIYSFLLTAVWESNMSSEAIWKTDTAFISYGQPCYNLLNMAKLCSCPRAVNFSALFHTILCFYWTDNRHIGLLHVQRSWTLRLSNFFNKESYCYCFCYYYYNYRHKPDHEKW